MNKILLKCHTKFKKIYSKKNIFMTKAFQKETILAYALECFNFNKPTLIYGTISQRMFLCRGPRG